MRHSISVLVALLLSAAPALSQTTEASNAPVLAIGAPASAAAVPASQRAVQPVAGPRQTTWANPVDIDYKYAFDQTHQGISYRTGADPVVVLHRDRYYLFMTQADGYWTSRDLVDWSFITPNRWPLDGSIGPAAVSDGERLYLLQSSTDPTPLLSSDRPETGRWNFHTRLMPAVPGAVTGKDPTPGPNDQLPAGPLAPDLFIDNDGKWFLYWGSSDAFPLYGSEIDPTPPVAFVDTPTTMFRLDPERHGWERFGMDHSGGLPNGSAVQPFIDGAWMSRAGGRYYLQYAGPGTEYNAYANGTYVGASPLGPFEYAPYSPISYKPGGFAQGAGGGSTFQDRYGNWFNTGTAWVGSNWSFERRMVMFPGGVHDDGQMWFSSRFGDFPHRMPDGPVLDPDSLFTGWMPLSYRAAASASSTLGEFTPDRATDEDPRTFWVAGGKDPGQFLTLDLGAVRTVQAVQVNYADYQSKVYGERPNTRARFRILWSVDGATWYTFASRLTSDRDRPNAYVQGDRPVNARYIRYSHGEVAADNLAIADLRVFGNAPGDLPPTPQHLAVTRGEDQRNAVVRFDPVPGVIGYNIRWGNAPDRLHLTYQIWADELPAREGQVEIRALNVGVNYHFAVEAFAATGVSTLSPVLAVPAGRTATVRAPEPAPMAVPEGAPATTPPAPTPPAS